MSAVVAGLADEDDNVKRNSVFCAGVCCEHLRERAAADYPTILHGIWPIFSLDASTGDDSVAACMDNAAAAVARMIMACQTHVPLAQVLPSFLRALPLKTDMTENETVYTCILGLLQMSQPDIVAHTHEVQRIFREACGASSQLDDETKAKLSSALQAL